MLEKYGIPNNEHCPHQAILDAVVVITFDTKAIQANVTQVQTIRRYIN